MAPTQSLMTSPATMAYFYATSSIDKGLREVETYYVNPLSSLTY
jgi:hypothetical protein